MWVGKGRRESLDRGASVTAVDLIALAVKVGHSAKLLGELDQSGVNVAGLGTAWCDQMSGHFVREIYGLGLDVEVEPW
jgi:hypothetical protein